jgi:hypothetical protein
MINLDLVTHFFVASNNTSSRTMALESTQPITDVPGIFLGVEGGQRRRLSTSPLSVSQLSRKFGSLDVSQPYEPWRPIGIALPFYLYLFYKSLRQYVCILCQHSTVSSRWGCFLIQHVLGHACPLQVLIIVTINVPYT